MGGKLCSTLCSTVGVKACCDCCGGGLLSRDVPWLPAHVTPARVTRWLHEHGALKQTNRVLTVDLTPFAVGVGIMSLMCKVQVKYLRPPESGLTDHFVCKLTPPELKPRIVGELLDLFLSEVLFFQKGLKEVTELDAPTCYFAAKSTGGRFCLLLEDLAPSKVGDQLEGLSIEHARQGVVQLAKLHSRFRGVVHTHEATKGWIQGLDDEAYYGAGGIVHDTFRKAVPFVTKERCLGLFGCDPRVLDVDAFRAAAQHVLTHYGGIVQLVMS